MERIQPPPNYYGAPYPQQMPDPNQPAPYPPQMNPYPGNYGPQQVPPEMMRTDSKIVDNVSEFYETFNKLISTNLGKSVIVHCSFTDSTKWHDMEFVGALAAAGDNYIIVYDQVNNKHILIVGVYIDYIEFVDKIMIDGVMSK